MVSAVRSLRRHSEYEPDLAYSFIYTLTFNADLLSLTAWKLYFISGAPKRRSKLSQLGNVTAGRWRWCRVFNRFQTRVRGVFVVRGLISFDFNTSDTSVLFRSKKFHSFCSTS